MQLPQYIVLLDQDAFPFQDFAEMADFMQERMGRDWVILENRFDYSGNTSYIIMRNAESALENHYKDGLTLLDHEATEREIIRRM